MKADEVIRKEGMDALFDKLGMVDAERFIFLTNKDNFDYTKWQRNLFENETVESLGKKVYEHCRNKELSVQ